MDSPADQSREYIVVALVTMTVTQALVVMCSLALPVLAPVVEESVNISASYIGLYASVLFCGALVSSLYASNIVIRYGALRTSQITLIVAAAGLLALLWQTPLMILSSALLIGLAYGPGNPASSRLLSRLTTGGSRSAIFSIKQTSVPLGGAIAGILLPGSAVYLGWEHAIVLAVLLCLLTALGVQPWRDSMDRDRDPSRALAAGHFLAPLTKVLSDRKLRFYGAIAFCYAALQFTFSAVFVTYLVDRAKLDSVSAGTVLSIALVTSVFARVAWGLFADQFRGTFILVALGLLMAGAGIASTFISPHWPYWSLVILGAWFGLAAYSWNGVYLAAVADVSGDIDVATATSGTMFMVFAGALAGPALFTGLYTATGTYSSGFIVLSVLTAITALLAARGENQSE